MAKLFLPHRAAGAAIFRTQSGVVGFVLMAGHGVFSWAGASATPDYEMDAAHATFAYMGGEATFDLVPYVPPVPAAITPRRWAQMSNPARRPANT